MFQNIKDIADAYDAGRWDLRPFIKVWPSTFNTAGGWYDGTVSGNYPRASYYPGDDLTFATYPAGDHLSHFHGGNVSPYQKVIKSILIRGSAAGVSPCHYILCDFIGFYQGISLEISDQQDLTNTVTLPRYTTGAGVQAFLVQLFGTNSNSIGTITYTNQNGTAGRVSQTTIGNTLGTGATQNSSVAGRYLPFIQLASGDTGIRSVQSVTFTTPGVGIAVLVLVKPLCEILTRDTNFIAPYEIDYFQDRQKMPIVPDGACLNWLMSPSATAAGLITMGHIEYIWG